jgi:methyl-accepting chemotaxis protein
MTSLFSGMTVKIRLIIGFGTVVVATAILSLVAFLGLSNSNHVIVEYRDNFIPTFKTIGEMKTNLLLIRRFELRMMLTENTQAFNTEINGRNSAVEKFQAESKKYTSLYSDDQDRKNHERLVSMFDKYIGAFPGLQKLGSEQFSSTQKREEALRYNDSTLKQSYETVANDFENLMSYNDKLIGNMNQESEKSMATTRTWLIGMSIFALALGICGAWLITRSILSELGTDPIELMNISKAISQGDLSVKIAADAAPGSVLAYMGEMRNSLRGIVAQVRQSTDSIASGITQISSGNTDLSQRTEEQASALQQTAATMEQFSTTVATSAQNANLAKQLADSATAAARNGGQIVSNVVATMSNIDASSKQISDIIGVIDGIAFQTNILALNAAVEAARAGEQGRGFAVVAGEVRALAQRSASAAKDIKTLINASVENVAEGTSLVAEAGKAMDQVVSSIQRVSDIVAEISAASTEQNVGVQQIGQAVSQLDDTTQQNAALVEESAAASKSLENQANDLVNAVAIFKLDAAANHRALINNVASTPQPRPSVSAPSLRVASSKTSWGSKPGLSGNASQPSQTKALPSSVRTGTDDNWESF